MGWGWKGFVSDAYTCLGRTDLSLHSRFCRAWHCFQLLPWRTDVGCETYTSQVTGWSEERMIEDQW
jgi:hypothetical protein